MTTDLDARARAASSGLKQAVAETDLKLASQLLEGAPRPWWNAPWTAFVAGVAVAAAVLVVVLIAPGDDEIEDVVTAPTTTTTIVDTTTSTVRSTPLPATDPDGSVTSSTVETSTTSTTLDTEPPALEILAPADGSEQDDARIEFSGVTEPGTRIFAGDYEATVESDGSWHIVLLLSPGENRARFVAEDAAGNQSEVWITVTLVVAEESTTTTKPETESPTTTKPEEEAWPEFKVEATYYESAAESPFDVYHGVGEPGTVVEVSSAYGAASTTIGSGGTFEVRVDYPEAPLGERFGVIVETSKGHRVELWFKRVE